VERFTNYNFEINEKEEKYLRDLAKKQLEYSQLPVMKKPMVST